VNRTSNRRASAEISTQLGGRHGGYVRLGDTAVPRRVVFSMNGERREPDLTMTFEVRDGRPECVEVIITAKPEGRGVTTADLQVFNLDAMATNVFTQFAMRVTERTQAGVRLDFPADETTARRAQRDVYEARKTRRGSVTRTELEEVARIYREHLDSSPTRMVRLLGRYDSERTAARRVQQARAAGLLPKTTPGKRKA
jgi:hypothetical protein